MPSCHPSRVNLPVGASEREITVLYEDRASGIMGKEFADRLQGCLPQESFRRIGLWRMELLDHAPIWPEIVEEVSASEFLIISLRGTATLSPASKGLIETWAGSAPGEQPTLVALFKGAWTMSGVSESIRCYLRFVSEENGVSFFGHCNCRPALGGAALPPKNAEAEMLGRSCFRSTSYWLPSIAA